MKKIFSGFPHLERAIGFGASFAEVCALFAAVYAFVFPAKVAEAVVGFEQLLTEARADLSDISENTAQTAENTRKTAENTLNTAENTFEISEDTQKIAEAVPMWVRFHGDPDIKRSMQTGATKVLVLVENDSPFAINLSAKVVVGGVEVVDQNSVVPSREREGFKSREFAFDDVSYFDDFSDSYICLSGKSKGFGNQTFYEKRTYWRENDGRLARNLGKPVDLKQAFSPIEGC
ncbi:hypothetical protein [Ruegeria arenilitoris]|uniref:hypothetical protein n=1 Tax=Ruegeria arenilitoris TaxID=1173585 RepID=UPI00147B2857|nr:hypothetical protein [Ruegeria arenilitoris]